MKPGERYDHKAIEKQWQSLWAKARLDQTDITGAKPPFYNLMMFPYPSAEGLHVGNMYAFTGSDIYGRFKRMRGFNVFEPIGLDGFGIHSENYAFKIGRHPADQAKVSQERFYQQLQQIGAMYDWSRTLETYNPDYYRWTQWLFVQMFKHGLAYRGKAEVNWCPSCKTVLADEQVVSGGCERCGNIVKKRLLEQWFFRITAYAGKLLKNLNSLDWSEKVKIAQRNWIGKKEGINITYPVINEGGEQIGEIICFTTRPDTNFGATFVVSAPENDFVSRITPHVSKEKKKEIETYIQAAKKKSKTERIAEGRKKTGVFTGLFCVNQLNNYKMPLYISDFVVMEVGTGAVVGVPAHDQRDLDFALTLNLPIKVVVLPDENSKFKIPWPGRQGRQNSKLQFKIKNDWVKGAYEGPGVVVNSDFLNGLSTAGAVAKIMDYLEEKGWGKRVTTYHLRDWLISRQRYWGPPIPMIFCQHCADQGRSWFTMEEAKSMNYELGIRNNEVRKKQKIHNSSFMIHDSKISGWYPINESELPVILPRIDDYKPGDDGVAPLAKHKEFYETICPGCGSKAVRETDVSDTFLDSSWYFLRYPSIGAAGVGAPWSRDGQGPDLAGVHKDSGAKAVAIAAKAVPPRSASTALPWDPEITKKWLPVSLYTGGAEHSVLHLMYSRFITMALHDWGYLDFEEPFPHFYAHGLVIKDGAKMSKSKGNVVNPDEYIALYGADALRLYLMFMGPFDQGGDFRDAAMEGMARWVNRVWRLGVKSEKLKVKSENQEITRALHKLVKKVTEDIEKRRYNTAIAAMMEFTNLVEDQSGILDYNSLKTFILLLAPFAPHLAEELWQRLAAAYRRAAADGEHWSVHLQPWPSFDPKIVEEDTVEIVVQVNGKLRDTCHLSHVTCHNQSEVEKLARESEKIRKYLAGQTVKKVIFVPGKLMNFVI